MSTDFEPVFVKGLKLLHSRSRDSLEQLKQLTDEVIALRRGELALKKHDDDDRKDDYKYSRKTSTKRDTSELDKRREAEKRSLEKLKDDLASLNDDPIPAKKIKLEPLESKPTTKELFSKDRERSRDSSKESIHREKRDEHKPTMKEDPSWLDFGGIDTKLKKSQEAEKKAVSVKPESESSEDEKEAGSFLGLDREQFETDMMDLACVVCKEIDQTSSNRLLDCQECHRLYHQDCHKPAVREDVDDPRFVWYCSKCSKNMKKMVKAQKPKSAQVSTSKEKDAIPATVKAFKSEPTTQTPFRRLDTSKASSGSKEGSSTSSSSSRPYTGLASLAANLSSKSHDTSKTGRSASLTEAKPSSQSKPDNKGLNFLFKPDAHKITSISGSKSPSSERGGLYKLSASASKASSLKSTPSVKPAGVSLLTKSGSTSSLTNIASPSPKSSTPPSMSRTSSTSSHGNGGGQKMMSSLMSADKKLQIMKKKAAAKAVEKKSFR